MTCHALRESWRIFGGSSMKTKPMKSGERRAKYRFPIHREMRYKLLKNGVITATGEGHTLNIGSGGISFAVNHDLPLDTYIELSISWPVLLENRCPMRMIAFGRLLRCADGVGACSIDKYEFRTQARVIQAPASRNDSMLQRWAAGLQKESLKAGAIAV